jgi:hypothetical protein
MNKDIKKKIEEDDIIFDTLGLEVVSLVEEPAIEVGWKAFEKQEVELVDIKHGDYTFSIEDQQEVLKIAEEVGETIDVEDLYLQITKEEFSTIGKILKGLSIINALTTNQASSDEGEVFYRYSGPIAERNFCKALQRLNKVFTREDIEQMEKRGLNRNLGHQGQPYSIWDFKGGKNCRHSWSKLLIFRGQSGNKVIIDEGPVSGLPGETMNSRPDKGAYPLSKQQFSIDDDKRIVIGPLLIPNKFIKRQDENGDVYHVFFSKETIRKVAEKFFKENKQNNTDINHDEVITKQNTLLESWIVEDTTHDKSFLYGFRLPKGTLMASYKINDDQTWSLIKEGKLNGFSIAGFFLEKNGKERKAEQELQKIIEMINEVE